MPIRPPKVIILIIAMAALALPFYAKAESLRLTSGKTIEGKILLRNDEMVRLETVSGISITYYYDEIESIDGVSVITDKNKIREDAAASLLPNKSFKAVSTQNDVIPTEPGGVTETTDDANKTANDPPLTSRNATLEGVDVLRKAPPSPVIKPEKSDTGDRKPYIGTSEADRLMAIVEREVENGRVLNSSKLKSGNTKNALVRIANDFIDARSVDALNYWMGLRQKLNLVKARLMDVPPPMRRTILFYCTLFLAGTYFLSGFPFMKIAKTFGMKHAWVSWVPFLQIFVLLKAATKPYWWLLLLCVPGIGIIVLFFVLRQFVRNLNRPVLFILPLLIPGINILVLWYLAFSPVKAKRVGKF